MQIQFDAISEPSEPGPKWQKLFNAYWPAYKAWFNSKGVAHVPDLKTSKAALAYYMPEMVPTYERLCKLVNADEVAARFLTGFQPPSYISACSQVVQTEDVIQLVRNYDYHPDLLEGTVLLSAWNGKKVIANTDCLIGVIDGMNEDGLVISLTFGGRKVVGKGFGIPIILRYVLEFCSNVEEAVEALKRIPSHMSYNVTVVDRTGTFKTVRLAPDRDPLVTNAAFTTNHQGAVDWPENARFNKTIERSAFLENKLSIHAWDTESMADAFLQPPLYNTLFAEGFGTLYTSVYRPVEGTLNLRWPNENMLQSFDDFKETRKLIRFNQAVPAVSLVNANGAPAADWQNALADTLLNAMAQIHPSANKEQLEVLREKIIPRGQISWEILADFWSDVGAGNWEKWKQ